MRKTTTKPVEEIYVYFCDICGKSCNGHTCVICGREICRECTVYHDMYDCDLREPNNYNSDRPERICRPCWDSGEEFREKIMEIREAKEKQEEELMKAWKFLTFPDRKGIM